MLSQLGELEAHDAMDVPGRVLERARNLVPERSSSWKVMLRFLNEGLELLQQTGTLLSARPLAVRGAVPEPLEAISEHYTFERDLPPWRVLFSVQRQDRSQVALTLSLHGALGPAGSFQVELWQDSRLRGIRSGVGGAVTFTGIQPGEYRLVVLEKAIQTGEVHLSLVG